METNKSTIEKKIKELEERIEKVEENIVVTASQNRSSFIVNFGKLISIILAGIILMTIISAIVSNISK